LIEAHLVRQLTVLDQRDRPQRIALIPRRLVRRPCEDADELSAKVIDPQLLLGVQGRSHNSG